MKKLLVRVKEIKGKCNIHKVGDYFEVSGSMLTLPLNRHVCFYALSSLIPLLPAKQRKVDEPNDWLPRVREVSCPDPEGRVIWEIVEMSE
ncbi:MAG: TIGR04076 family protein [Sulfolobales archaeon]|nr:TIGR04076 family protein [Sulfolobales archaeon]